MENLAVFLENVPICSDMLDERCHWRPPHRLSHHTLLRTPPVCVPNPLALYALAFGHSHHAKGCEGHSKEFQSEILHKFV